MKREYGFYWVILKPPHEDEWTVAEYSVHGWQIIGSEEFWSENIFLKVFEISLKKP